MLRHFVPFLFLCLSACGSLKDYDITLNDRVLYTPRPLTVDPAISDPALADCIGQTLADQQLSASTQLQSLICTTAGIQSLAGLDVYPALRRIKLSGNAVEDVSPLDRLTQLQALWLDDNQLVDVGVLAALGSLELLDLEGNPELDCNSARALPVASLQLPEHCGS